VNSALLGEANKTKSIAEQFLQLIPRRVFARILVILGRKIAARKFKILAEIPHGLLRFRFCATVAALMRRARVVTRTIQAHPQICAAAMAALAPARLSGERPFPTAFMAMPCHQAACFA
jgi:hypothetical protein